MRETGGRGENHRSATTSLNLTMYYWLLSEETVQYAAKSIVAEHVKKIPIINQNHIFFLLWSHFWIDFNKFYSKTFGIIYILLVYLLIMAFFSATIDGRNLIFGHKLHIGTPYRFWTRQIPTSCLPKSGGMIYHKWALAHSSSCLDVTWLFNCWLITFIVPQSNLEKTILS